MAKSIRRFSTTTVLLLCFLLNSHAQSRDSLLTIYNNQTIHNYGNWFAKGNQQLKFHDLKTEFISLDAQTWYRKSKTNRVWSRILTATSITAFATSTVLRYNNKSKGGSLAFAAAGVVLNLGSYQLRKQSHEKLGQALWLHNRDVLFGAQQ